MYNRFPIPIFPQNQQRHPGSSRVPVLLRSPNFLAGGADRAAGNNADSLLLLPTDDDAAHCGDCVIGTLFCKFSDCRAGAHYKSDFNNIQKGSPPNYRKLPFGSKMVFENRRASGAEYYEQDPCFFLARPLSRNRIEYAVNFVASFLEPRCKILS